MPTWPRPRRLRCSEKQVLRSGTSVGANYREAWRARSKAEFISSIGICPKELDETSYWLELLVDARLLLRTLPVPTGQSL
ncbi:MAG: four helix bundle protein [Puniceicoccaceae bacterium]